MRFNTLAQDLSVDEVEALIRVAQALYLLPVASRHKARKRRSAS
jgi:hypothetical protein